MANQPDLNKLKSTLLTSGLQQSNPPLYQVINSLLEAIRQLQSIFIGNINEINNNINNIIININNSNNQAIKTSVLDGQDGQDGFNIPGRDGRNGINGINGLDGLDGEDAPLIMGPMGKDGLKGNDGINGLDGNDGLDSLIPGPIGLQGIQGLTIPGMDGNEGTDLYQFLIGSAATSSGSSLFTEQTTTATGTQNDFSLSANLTYLRVNNASAVTFTGFTINGSTPTAGAQVIIDNIAASTVKVANQTGSTAANQIITESAAGQIIGQNGRLLAVYDDTTDRWRITVVAPGLPIDITYASGDFVADTGTWTVASGDIRINKFVQQGRTILVLFGVVATTTSNATAALQYNWGSASGFTITGNTDAVGWGLNNGTNITTRVLFSSSANAIRFLPNDGSNWAVSTDLTNCTIAIQIIVN